METTVNIKLSKPEEILKKEIFERVKFMSDGSYNTVYLINNSPELAQFWSSWTKFDDLIFTIFCELLRHFLARPDDK